MVNIFLEILGNIYPLYLLILLGFIAGKYLGIEAKSIARLLIYIVLPVIIFNGVYESPNLGAVFVLPLVWFVLSCTTALLSLAAAKFAWGKDRLANIFAYMSGSANVGYLGIPLAQVILGDEAVVVAVYIVIGYLLYENTVGYYIASAGDFSAFEILKKLLKLPPIYGFILGGIALFLQLDLGGAYGPMVENFRGVFVVTGMMLVGLGLAGISKVEFDLKFLSLAFISQFILWPAIVFAAVAADVFVFGFFTEIAHLTFILIAATPLAANTTAYATILKNNPEKVAMAVFLTTLFSLIYIPVYVALLVL